MTTAFKVLPAAAALAGMALVTSANAQALPQKMTIACTTFSTFCVYDNVDGSLLGISLDEGRLTREINGKLYIAGYNENGLIRDLALFYTSTDGSGPPLIQSGYIGPDGATPVADSPPVSIQWDGTNFWGASGPATVAMPQSTVCYGLICNGAPEGVVRPYSAIIAYGYPTFAPAKVLDTPKIAAPTAACEAAQNCVTIK